MKRGLLPGLMQPKGKCEMANGGTLFLDEVGNISMGVQAKLLRFLETRTLEKIGGGKPIPVSVRLIAATNVDLTESLKTNLFRMDLFYRLNEFPIHLPPLRERIEDIPLLCQRFLHSLAPEVGKEVLEISPEAIEALKTYAFPGNVRELKNVMMRTMVTTHERINLKDLPPEVKSPQKNQQEKFAIPTHLSSLPLKEASRQLTSHIEKQLIEAALLKSEGRRGKASQILGVDEKTLYNKMKEYEL